MGSNFQLNMVKNDLGYSPVCFVPGWKPQRQNFSQRGSFHFRRNYLFLTTRRYRARPMAVHSPSATTIVFQSSVILLLWCVLVGAYHDYCIIGAGPSGLQMGYFFQRAARDYVIYEKSNVSGTVSALVICSPLPPPSGMGSGNEG